MDSQTLMLFGGIGAILVIASLIGLILKLRTRGSPNAVIDNLNGAVEKTGHGYLFTVALSCLVYGI